MDIELTKAEICAIEAHKYFMSQRYGHDVGVDAARKDWLDNCAAAWREERHRQMLDLECDEIRRHVWIESEKAQHDVRREAALDWVLRYAKQWREWYDREHESV